MAARRSSGRYLVQRSTREWIVRGAIALAAALVGIASVSNTIANGITKFDPMRAMALAFGPGSGMMLGNAAEQLFMLEPSADENSEAAQMARSALLADATAADAAGVLALQAQLRGDINLGRRLFKYSRELSRRELQTHIWAIEEAVKRGDIDNAIINYDLALRTSKKSRELLFPILASAISEPKVSSRLLDTMAGRPVWGKDFIDFLTASGKNPKVAVSFVESGKDIDLPVDDTNRSNLVNALAEQGLFWDAWKYYASFRPNVSREKSRNATFSSIIQQPAVFDWTPVNSDGVAVSIIAGDGGGEVDFSVTPSTGATLLRQIQVLPAGDYRFEGRTRNIEQPESSRPYWVISCSNGPEITRMTIPNSGMDDSGISRQFSIPSGCAVQALSLVARPSDHITGVSGQITRAQIVPDY